MARIVVGVDGSEESRAALRWAVEEARLRGATLRVVYAWTIRYAVGMGVVPPEPMLDEVREEGARMLDSVIAEIGAEGVDVERVSVEGGAAQVLVEAAEGADLLVVGSRGRGGFTGLLLGSVGQQCAHHASCPVVIVRGCSSCREVS